MNFMNEHHDTHLSMHTIGQMSIMNFCKISFDFKVGSGRFRFHSFLNNKLKWSVWVVSAILKVGASLISLKELIHKDIIGALS